MTRGGTRTGAGRPARQGAKRVNIRIDNEVHEYLKSTGNVSAEIERLARDEMNTKTHQVARQEAADAVRDAQDLLNQAIEILSRVARDTDDQHAEAYIVDQLKTLASENHGFLCSDYNLDEWISDLENEEE